MQTNVVDVLSGRASHPTRTGQRLQVALAAGKLGAWEFEIATRVLTATPQCKANHGLAPDANLQFEADVIPAIDPEHRGRFRSAVETAIETRGSFELDVPHTWPDGSRHWVLIAGRVVPEGDCMVGVSRDTTRQHEAEAALIEADRRKDEFLAVLAHELRNPLAPILTAARILQLNGPQNPELQKARDVIMRQTIQLTKLVDDLLDVGRITTGKLTLQKIRVELNALLRQASETCAPAVERQRHTLELSLPDPPLQVDVDAGRIVQVVCNLVHNAVKYMPEGGRILLSASADGNAAVIRVRDEGVGIPPERLDEIFDRFVQLGTSQYRRNEGLGIGLSLVRAVVELHGGSVAAHSDGVGTGSEFVVRLPLLAD